MSESRYIVHNKDLDRWFVEFSGASAVYSENKAEAKQMSYVDAYHAAEVLHELGAVWGEKYEMVIKEVK